MRPVLVGMNNPYGIDPYFALYPSPEGSAGYRLWRMLHEVAGVSRAEYLRVFDRRNLLTGEWRARRAAVAATQMIMELEGRTVVVLGQDVRQAFGLPRLLIHPQQLHGVTWRQLPHPSGRSQWYNSPVNRRIAGMLLEELYHAFDRSEECECGPAVGPGLPFGEGLQDKEP